MSLLIQNATLITCDPSGSPQVLAGQDVICDAGVIHEVRPTGRVDLRKFAEVVPAAGHIVLPGLINTHHHLYQTLTRGLKAAQNAPLFTWLTELYERWQHVDYHAVKTAAKVSLAELALSGCTTTSDHFYLFPQNTDVRLEAVLEAAEEVGVRIHACRGSMTLGRSRGGLPPDVCTERDDHVLADCRRVVERFHDRDPLAMRRIDLAPCTPFNVTTELFRETAALARSLGVLLHTHAAETLDEQHFCLERFGVRPIQFLADQGFLGPDVYLAHCVHLDPQEIAVLAETRTGVAHCPCSNMRLGSGVPPVRLMVAAGVKVGLAVDGSSSNDGGHVLAEARQSLLLQRVAHGPDAFSVADAFRLATVGGAACLGRERLGRIAPEGAADLAFYRRDDIALAGAVEQDPLGALILCRVGRADKVMCAGRWIVQDGRLCTADQDRLARDLNELVRARFSW